jgi:hypothetical protein
LFSLMRLARELDRSSRNPTSPRARARQLLKKKTLASYSSRFGTFQALG